MSPRRKKVLFTNRTYSLTARSFRQGDTSIEVLSPQRIEIIRGSQRDSLYIPPVPEGCVGYHSDQAPLLTAMYALAMHEVHRNLTPEGVLKAGAAWSGVWTRDIAYAAVLGADLAAPEACRESLRCRVRDGVIIQDTGTGGGWPISTDRVSWALGAWCSYLSAGGEDWLRFCIDTLIKTFAQDDKVLRPNPLFPGETTFLDWREQSYPEGMTPAQIGASYAFGTNVLHCMSRRLLGRMLQEAGRPEEAQVYMDQANQLSDAINATFWHSGTDSYFMLKLPDGCMDMRTDALATALAVLSGVAGGHAQKALRALPRSVFGTPVFSPYKKNLADAYHNRAIWPFVEAFVLLAHADVQDMAGVEFGMASMLRAALVNGTNKENLHAENGEADATLQNSDSQLWSAAGMLGLFYHALLGIQYEHDSLVFNPCVPRSLVGSHWFTGIRIRNMVLDVHLNGYGSNVASVIINGKAGSPVIPLDTEGHIQVELELLPNDDEEEADESLFIKTKEDLPAPVWDGLSPSLLRWKPVPGAKFYKVYSNGTCLRTVRKTSYHPIYSTRSYTRFYRVQAISESRCSEPSVPLEYIAPGARVLLSPTKVGEHAEYDVQQGQAWLDTRPCTRILVFSAATLGTGTYGVRVRYSNATASLRDADTCALRELWVDERPVAIIPLPHNTEQDRWEDYTLTALVKLHLSEGTHEFSLRYTPDCVNGNGDVNQCMVRELELIRLR